MAEGLRMFHARYERDKSKRIPVSDINETNKEGLICEYCDAKISWIKPHKRCGKNISAFLRLQPNAKHSSQCNNIVKNSLHMLVAQSQNIEDGKSIIDTDGSNYIFRMNVLIDASVVAKKAKKAMEDESSPEEKARKRIHYQKSERRLADYFNTAAGVAQLRARIEESDDKKTLSALVKIDFDGKQISWNDFFYDEDRYPVLFKKAGKISHPVAILVTVKSEQKSINHGGNTFYSLNGEVCILENQDKTKDYFSPSLTCNEPDFFEKLRPREECIVVGYIEPKTKPWKNNIVYKNLSIHVMNKKQIARIKN